MFLPAAQGNHVEVLRILLRAGAEVDAPTARGRWTPLHVAARYTSFDCVVELLRWGADLGPTARPRLAGPSAAAAAVEGGDGTAPAPPSRRSGGWFFRDAHEGFAVSGDRDEEEGTGYGKTPAEVVGLRHLAAAAAVADTGPAGNGGNGAASADPSQDEEGEQMVVLGDDDDDDGEKSPEMHSQESSTHPSVLRLRPTAASGMAIYSSGCAMAREGSEFKGSPFLPAAPLNSLSLFAAAPCTAMRPHFRCGAILLLLYLTETSKPGWSVGPTARWYQTRAPRCSLRTVFLFFFSLPHAARDPVAQLAASSLARGFRQVLAKNACE